MILYKQNPLYARPDTSPQSMVTAILMNALLHASNVHMKRLALGWTLCAPTNCLFDKAWVVCTGIFLLMGISRYQISHNHTPAVQLDVYLVPQGQLCIQWVGAFKCFCS